MKFKKMVEGKNGWTEWVYPKPDSYLMQCCDCGLVHELQFKTFVETNQKRGSFTVTDLPWPIRAKFRARRQRKSRR